MKRLFSYWYSTLPDRCKRWFIHVFLPMYDPFLKHTLQLKRIDLFIFHYFIEWPLVTLDILGLPEWFGLGQMFFKRDSRHLHEHEIKLANEIFQGKVNLPLVRIDENCKIGTQGGKYAFVSYYYINCVGHMTLPVLIHELVHVLQFQQEGSRYAIRNLIAHTGPDTYNYGGLEKLILITENPSLIHDINYEQRADIFSDYCLLLQHKKPEWGRATLGDAIVYFKVIKLLLK